MICVTEGCGKPVDSKGLCSRCYAREYMRKRRAEPAYRAKCNAITKAYRKANPEKVRETKRRVRAKYKDEIAAYRADYQRRKKTEINTAKTRWRKANRDRVLESKKRYRKKHHDKVVKKAAEWAAKNPEKMAEIAAKYREANKDKTAARGKRWRTENPDRHAARQKARETRKARAMPAWAKGLDYLTVYKTAALLSKQTGIKHHVDHIVPLQGRLVSGLHVPWNLQAIPAEDNLRKSNRF